MLSTQQRIAGGIVAVGLLATLFWILTTTQQVFQVLQAARPTPSVYFNSGLTSVDINAPRAWTNKFCGSCHKKAFEQWSRSRHAVSGTTHNFEVEFLAPAGGRQQFCINCHAPRNPTGKLFPTEEPRGVDAAYKETHAWVANGVDCLTCHVRNGKVLVTKHSDKAAEAHPIRVAPELGRSEFCASCHQFSFKSNFLPDGFFGQLQQASFEEFLDVHAEGEIERCHACHMPSGDHTMPGGYDDDMLRSAVDLEVRATWPADSKPPVVEVDVIGGYVGHRIPGGEHFRFLTARTTITDADGKTIGKPKVESMRRVMGPAEQGSHDRNDKPSPDTRLRPGEIRRFRYPLAMHNELKFPLKIRAEVWYHLMDDSKAETLNHSLDDIKKMILSQETTLDLNEKK